MSDLEYEDDFVEEEYHFVTGVEQTDEEIITITTTDNVTDLFQDSYQQGIVNDLNGAESATENPNAIEIVHIDPITDQIHDLLDLSELPAGLHLDLEDFALTARDISFDIDDGDHISDDKVPDNDDDDDEDDILMTEEDVDRQREWEEEFRRRCAELKRKEVIANRRRRVVHDKLADLKGRWEKIRNHRNQPEVSFLSEISDATTEEQLEDGGDSRQQN